MLAYQAHPALTRDVMLREVAGHIAAHRYVEGRYWREGRGCAVGCALYSVARLTGETIQSNDHSAFPRYLGIPVELAYLQDVVFEGLPATLQATWPWRFASAIQQGADLDSVVDRVLVRLLHDILLPVAKSRSMRTVIKDVGDGLETGWTEEAQVTLIARTMTWTMPWWWSLATAKVYRETRVGLAVQSMVGRASGSLGGIVSMVYWLKKAVDGTPIEAMMWSAIADIVVAELAKAPVVLPVPSRDLAMPQWVDRREMADA